MADKDLPELNIDPLFENGKGARMRKGQAKKKADPVVPITEKKGNDLNPLHKKEQGHGRPNSSIENASQTRKIEIATDMYNMILAGKSEKQIADKYNCEVQTVRRYLETKLADAQEKLIMLRAKFSLLGFERIEKYIIDPTIAKIEQMIKDGEYDSRAYETLMKAIKLEAELVSPKTSVNVNNATGTTTFIAAGNSVYNRIAEAMRKEEVELGGVIIDSELVELNSLGIDKL